MRYFDVTPSIPVAKVREPPDIGQIHGKTNDGQQEVQFGIPGLSLLVAMFFILLLHRGV